MRPKILAVVIALTLCSSVSWAGRPTPTPAPVGAPLMDDGGLIFLALALVGTGLTFLRGNKR